MKFVTHVPRPSDVMPPGSLKGSPVQPLSTAQSLNDDANFSSRFAIPICDDETCIYVIFFSRKSSLQSATVNLDTNTPKPVPSNITDSTYSDLWLAFCDHQTTRL